MEVLEVVRITGNDHKKYPEPVWSSGLTGFIKLKLISFVYDLSLTITNPNMFHVEEDVLKRACRLLGATEKTVNEDVDIIKKWITTQPHLPEIMEDVKIRNFLLMNKCSIERTKQKIDMYYTIRSLIPDFFVDCNPKLDNMKSLMETSYCSVHPNMAEKLERVFFLGTKAPNKFSPREMSLQCFNIGEMRLYEDIMMDDIIIFDMINITLSDITKVTLSLAIHTLAMYEKVYSFRLKAAYLLNSPPYVTKIMALLKSVMKPKMFNRIHVCQDAEVLKEIFSKDALPKDYGGEGPSLQELNEMTERKLAQYQDRFDKLDKLRVDESLRPEKLDNCEALGFYGNFKKLNLD